MKLLVEELRGTNRKIVTNLAILQDELGEYLHEKYSETFDLLTRLHIIEDDEIEFFYCHRGDPAALQLTLDKKGRPLRFDIETASKGGGVFYILDEVHLAFGARDWQNMGQACTFYASQHRKLGDDVVLITQAPKMVDTTFRNLAQDYTVLRNHALEKLLIFKQPKLFTRQTFMNLPTPNEKPLEKSVFRMDLKVAACYDTAQGVGIHERGKEADKDKDGRKGLSWAWGVVAAVAIIGLASQIPSACGSAVVGTMDDASKQATENLTKASAAVTNRLRKASDVVGLDENSTPILEVHVPAPPAEPDPESKSEIAGFFTKGKGDDWEMVVLLATGEKLSFQNGDISGITSTHVEDLHGVKHYFKRPINLLKLRGLRD